MPGGNFKVHVRSDDHAHFEQAVKMGFANSPGGKATHYVSPLPERRCTYCSGSGKHYYGCEEIVDGVQKRVSHEYPCSDCRGTGRLPPRAAMILLWHDETSVAGMKPMPLPFPLDAGAAVDFLWGYLMSAEYGPQPDIDGSNHRGFIVTTGDFWGHVEGNHYAFLGVYPDWQMYGK